MLLESKVLKDILIQNKQEAFFLLDKTIPPKVRLALDERIRIIDTLLVWVNTSEKEGEIKLDTLKLGELTKWEPAPKQNSVDEKIIADSKNLKKNFDAIKVTVSTIQWNTLQARTYDLRTKGKLRRNIVPRLVKTTGEMFLVYMDNPPARRGTKK